jgi:putative transposase
LRRRCPQPDDKWHLDGVFLTITGTQHYVWRTVDQRGNVSDILVQSRRNNAAAARVFRKSLNGCHNVPRVIITDKLASYIVYEIE